MLRVYLWLLLSDRNGVVVSVILCSISFQIPPSAISGYILGNAA